MCACNGREATARLSNLRNLRTLLIRSSAVGSENLKKFSLNPVEGISTSASMCITEAETTDYTDAQIQKEQMRFMKITQNAVTVVVNWGAQEFRGAHSSPAGVRAPSRHCASHSEAATAAALWAAFLMVTMPAFAQNPDNIAERE